MQLSLRAILLRAEDQRVCAALDRQRGDLPLAWLVLVVREPAAGDLARLRSGIIQLDPVDKVAVGVRHGGLVGGLDFAEDDFGAVGLGRRLRRRFGRRLRRSGSFFRRPALLRGRSRGSGRSAGREQHGAQQQTGRERPGPFMIDKQFEHAFFLL